MEVNEILKFIVSSLGDIGGFGAFCFGIYMYKKSTAVQKGIAKFLKIDGYTITLDPRVSIEQRDEKGNVRVRFGRLGGKK